MPDLVLSVREAAEVLRISRQSLYVVLNNGELKSIKVGKRRLVPVAELERFVSAKLTGGAA